MCLTETYSRVRVGKNLSDMFPIRNGLKQGDALSPLLFNFALVYVIRRVQVNQDGLKLTLNLLTTTIVAPPSNASKWQMGFNSVFKGLKGTHQLLAYADDVNILGGNAHTVKENAETLVGATKEIGLEVNVASTVLLVTSFLCVLS